MSAGQQIFIRFDSFEELELFFTRSFSSCFVLVDENTLEHCYPFIAKRIPEHEVIQIPSGEHYKNIETCRLIWTEFTEANADRKSLLINLGGGVIGDMGGFAAACYKRGIAFINIPTTLLAMADASVGGKTGIDFMGFKNQVGTFSQPEAVFINTLFLATLPPRQITSGFAEVIKHYLIADREAFEDIFRKGSDIKTSGAGWTELIKKSVQIKSYIVEQDPGEKGVRKALNFGHTIGHAVESCFLTGNEHCLLHGEAIAIGMVAESYISFKKGLLPADEMQMISDYILMNFEVPKLGQVAQSEIMKLIKQDKKNENDGTRFTLLQDIGNYCINNAVEEELISESLHYYNSQLK